MKDIHELTVEKLESANQNTTRLVKKAESYFNLLPADIPEFNHFDPSMFLLEHPQILKGRKKSIQTTLNRFESAFERIANFLQS